MKSKWLLIFLCFFSFSSLNVDAYPYNGYATTGIKRLKRLELIENEKMDGKKLIPGALNLLSAVKLNLVDRNEKLKDGLPSPDPVLQKKLNKLFPRLDESYAIALLDITPGREMRYAGRKEDRGFQPGSVGKLAVISGFFNELQCLFPGSFEKRQQLLKDKIVRAGKWAVYDEHTVPFFDPETEKFQKRQVRESDTFSLYEWADHMMSVSNNGAASVVWREAILMCALGDDYPKATEKDADEYFKTTKRSGLMDLAIEVINQPLRDIGISHDEWRLGMLFTRGATSIIPGKGGSIGTTSGLMKFLVAMEQGLLIDKASSLEIKRLMYMTDRRIRYAAASKLKDAGVYFKSGSLYSCDRSKDAYCGKYKGNVKNYMNSVAIIEHPDSTNYLVVLMSNVLRKNSSNDHYALAGKVDELVREEAE